MKTSDLRNHIETNLALLHTEPIDFNDMKTRFVIERCRGRKVLDLGCVMHDEASYNSRYFLHRAIAEVAESVVGLDLHGPGVLALQAKGFNVIQADAEHFSFNEKFSVIVAGDLIEHLGNVEGFLTSCIASLKDDGRIIIQTPNPWYWRNVVKAVLHKEVPNNAEHTCWFDPRTLRQLIERYGLTIDEIEFQSRYRRDLFMPLPRGLKHTSWAASLRKTSATQ